MTKRLIIEFSNDAVRENFISRFDYMISAPISDGLEDQLDQISFIVPDKEGDNKGSYQELFNLFYNRVPFGKTTKEVHGW